MYTPSEGDIEVLLAEHMVIAATLNTEILNVIFQHAA